MGKCADALARVLRGTLNLSLCLWRAYDPDNLFVLRMLRSESLENKSGLTAEVWAECVEDSKG
jgi:hypothetical protein